MVNMTLLDDLLVGLPDGEVIGRRRTTDSLDGEYDAA